MYRAGERHLIAIKLTFTPRIDCYAKGRLKPNEYFDLQPFFFSQFTVYRNCDNLWFRPVQTSSFKTAESSNQEQVRDVVSIIRCRDALVIGDGNDTSPVFQDIFQFIPTNEPCLAL